MPRIKPKSRVKSTRERVIERAIRAAQDNFERAFVAEWDIRADSASIRNATAVLPSRCRHCGKPIAGVGALCACKTKVDAERFFANPRDAFRSLFRQRCQSLLTSESLATFVATMSNLAVANDHDLDWVEGQIQKLLPIVKGVGRKWVIGICPPPSKHTGLLPAWIKDERDAIPEGNIEQCLSTADSEKALIGLEAQISQYFEEWKKAAIGQASLQIAQVVGPNSGRLSSRRMRQDSTAAIIARVKRDNPGMPIEKICQFLDANHWPLREIYQSAGFKNWHDAWKDPKFRQRIKRFISGIQPAAPNKASK